MRPRRSAKRPATRIPTAPLPMTMNDPTSASRRSPRAMLARSITGDPRPHRVQLPHVAEVAEVRQPHGAVAHDVGGLCEIERLIRQRERTVADERERRSSRRATASTEATATLMRQFCDPIALTRYGDALPSVSAPTSTPRAKPRPSRNQVAMIFIPGG